MASFSCFHWDSECIGAKFQPSRWSPCASPTNFSRYFGILVKWWRTRSQYRQFLIILITCLDWDYLDNLIDDIFGEGGGWIIHQVTYTWQRMQMKSQSIRLIGYLWWMNVELFVNIEQWAHLIRLLRRCRQVKQQQHLMAIAYLRADPTRKFLTAISSISAPIPNRLAPAHREDRYTTLATTPMSISVKGNFPGEPFHHRNRKWYFLCWMP